MVVPFSLFDISVIIHLAVAFYIVSHSVVISLTLSVILVVLHSFCYISCSAVTSFYFYL